MTTRQPRATDLPGVVAPWRGPDVVATHRLPAERLKLPPISVEAFFDRHPDDDGPPWRVVHPVVRAERIIDGYEPGDDLRGR